MEGVLIRFLNSISDATFWILIIITVGFVGIWVYKRVFDFMYIEEILNETKKSEDGEEEEEK